MSARTTQGLFTLDHLQAISLEMLASAESGDWDAVAITDKKRLQILQNLHNNDEKNAASLAHKQLTDQILSIDTKIIELASNERKLIMDKGLRQKAQHAAQSSYKQNLSNDTGF